MIVSWNTTNACNMYCAHCYRDAGCKAEEELSTAEAKTLLEQIARAGFKIMIFSGGEPLLVGLGVTDRVVQVLGGGQQVRVSPYGVASLEAPVVLDGGPEVLRVAHQPRPQAMGTVPRRPPPSPRSTSSATTTAGARSPEASRLPNPCSNRCWHKTPRPWRKAWSERMPTSRASSPTTTRKTWPAR